jgi:DNA-binding response OmpR family regulator
MQQALQSSFAVQMATSVLEAKRVLENTIPDVLISEVVLVGRENGLDLCRYIRSRASLQRLPIMLLTSRATLQDKVAGFEAGADDYVVKPFDTRHLMARIRLLTRIKRLEQGLE